MAKNIKDAHNDLKAAVRNRDGNGAREALNEIAKTDPAESKRIEQATIANAVKRHGFPRQ